MISCTQLKKAVFKKLNRVIEAPESSSEDIFNSNMIHINTSHLIDLVLFLMFHWNLRVLGLWIKIIAHF